MALRIQDPLASMKLAVLCSERAEASPVSTAASIESNSEENQSDSDRISTTTLRCNGEVWSEGSAQHPDNCTPCAFYCFKQLGCSKDKDCNFCHMSHVSKQRQRREEWKLHQREKRRSMRVQLQCSGPTPVAATATRQDGFPSQAKTLPDKASASQSCKEVYLVSEAHGAPVHAEEPCFISLGANCRLYQLLQAGAPPPAA